MIVACEKCSKNFNIRDDLIPKQGRLLQCGNCKHKWFYKPINKKADLETENTNDIINNSYSAENDKKISKKLEENSTPVENKIIKKEEKKIIKQKNKRPSLMKKFMVLIISVIALLILIDTFKIQLVKFIPGIDVVLDNLYETLKDLSLFLKDLIN